MPTLDLTDEEALAMARSLSDAMRAITTECADTIKRATPKFCAAFGFEQSQYFDDYFAKWRPLYTTRAKYLGHTGDDARKIFVLDCSEAAATTPRGPGRVARKFDDDDATVSRAVAFFEASEPG